MNERQRVEALLSEGKISEEEAQLLFEALDEAETAEAMAEQRAQGHEGQHQASRAQAEGEGQPREEPDVVPFPEPPAPPEPSPTAPPEPNRTARQEANTTRWLRIGMMARNLEVRCEDGLSEPRVKGATLERVGDDWAVEAQGIDAFLSGRGSLDIAVPPGCGVDLTAKAGNIEVSGVPFLRGRVIAGNVELDEVGGLDLEMKAGNLDASLRLTEGEHRVQVAMGNADIRLLKGSSVELSSKVSMGALDIDGPTKVGQGKARFDLIVKMGNLDVTVPRA